MSKKIAITFPGQGPQSVGMLAELAAAHPLVRETFVEGSDALGVDLWTLSQEGPKEQLNETRNTQPALLCAGMSVMRVIERIDKFLLALPVFDTASLDAALESINA